MSDFDSIYSDIFPGLYPEQSLHVGSAPPGPFELLFNLLRKGLTWVIRTIPSSQTG